MTGKADFIGEARKRLLNLGLVPTEIEEDLRRIEVGGGTIDLELLKGEKVSKAVLSSIKIEGMSVSEESVIVWPEEGYDFPILWCNLTTMPGMNMTIMDFMPLMDIVVWQDYAEKYLNVLAELKEKSLGIFGGAVVEKDFHLSSVVGWALSPYKALIKLSEEGTSKVADVLALYCDAYSKILREAMPVEDPRERGLSARRREAVRKLMKENDPGYPIMAGIFGDERTRKVFDIVF